MILIRGLDIPVDIQTEIESHDWERASWKGDRLIACSPFREENNPSFAVNLENGTFIDSGGDGEFRKGNFVKLLSYLRGMTYEDTEEYLLSTYSIHYGDIEEMELPSIDDWLDEDHNDRTFDKDELKPYLFKHPYLERRGIPYKIQRAFDVGYDPNTQSVVLVWHDLHGNIVSWKHRSVRDKKFWYVKGGQPIRNHLYGIHWIVKRGFKKAWIVESEIDALTLWSQGIPSIAIGTSFLSNAKKELILKTGIETLVIATDNDEDGLKGKRSIVEALAGMVELYEVDWNGVAVNDINDARDFISELNINEIDVLGW